MSKTGVAYLLAAVLLGGITVSAAILHGTIAHRWKAPSDTAAMVKLIDRVPSEFGDWRLVGEMPLTKSVEQILQCTNYVNRTYSNLRTGDQVAVTLLLGPPGPMTVHTPEVCKTSRDFESIGLPDRVTIATENATSQFYYSMFRSSNPTLPAIEVFYGWNKLEGWDAPDAPRFAYGGTPLLFKLQVASQLGPNVGSGQEGLSAKFLNEFLLALPDEFKSSGRPSASTRTE